MFPRGSNLQFCSKVVAVTCWVQNNVKILVVHVAIATKPHRTSGSRFLSAAEDTTDVGNILDMWNLRTTVHVEETTVINLYGYVKVSEPCRGMADATSNTTAVRNMKSIPIRRQYVFRDEPWYSLNRTTPHNVPTKGRACNAIPSHQSIKGTPTLTTKP